MADIWLKLADVAERHKDEPSERDQRWRRAS